MKIKFEDDYDKLPENSNGQPCKLETLWTARLEDLPQAFLNFDTRKRNGSHYQFLRKGMYIVLVFQHMATASPIVTVRPYNSAKFDFYKKNIGQLFEIEIVAVKGAEPQDHTPLISVAEAPG